MDNPVEIMAKGPNFFYAREYIKKEYGEKFWQKMIGKLSEADADIWRGMIVVVNKYPFSAFKSMYYALSDELNVNKDLEISKMYEYIADRSLNLIFKIFFKFSHPSFVISNYPKLWERFFTGGEVTVPVAEKSHAIVKFILPEIFMDWLNPACLGFSRKAVALAGAKNLIMNQKSKKRISDNIWEIEYELNWFER
ncbi:MAG: hypothetical protein JW871_05260 [Endomicrobiales bacterium]|nr:hypothetical protein [Endomicrobiales bacterium]